jgi:hypothetical protein
VRPRDQGGGCGRHKSDDCAGDQGCTSAVDLWLLSIDDKSKAFTWASMSANTGLPSNLTGADIVGEHYCICCNTGAHLQCWVWCELMGAVNTVLLRLFDTRA